ncbi:MAG: hypothetical protein JW814_05705 [Candidatus Krumholzibacteriota bacterium]|nr:hypothetical protein [Candidatus Krumholzibacteriota bacterium]
MYKLFLIGIIVICYPACLHAEIVAGTAELTYGYWDFYLMQSLPFPEAGQLFVTFIGPDMVIAAYRDAQVAAVPDSSFEELMYAPSDYELYYSYQLAVNGRTYVYRLIHPDTGDITYAKVRFSDFAIPVMDYAYQLDGSLKLYDEVPTENNSWGKIKILFKGD